MRLGVRQSDIQLDAFSLGMAIVSIACQLMAHLRRRTLAHTAQHSTVDACERVGTRQIETGTSEYKRAKDQCEGERERGTWPAGACLAARLQSMDTQVAHSLHDCLSLCNLQSFLAVSQALL